MLHTEVIDLPLPIPGYYNFFSAWFGCYRGKTFLVDPGPTASIDGLITQLKARGCEHIDHLLLTHIHLDHAGGAGTLVQNFSVGDITCYSKAIKHLVNPQQLWEGSVETLGSLAQIQGKPLPVPEKLFIPHDADTLPDIIDRVIHTPGHASHHISFQIADTMFVGEALGVILPTVASGYMRPATPPRFFVDSYRDSINKLRQCSAERLCFGHFGSLESTDTIFERSLEQISLWIETVTCLMGKEDFLDRAINRLIEEDPLFLPYRCLPDYLQQRERKFVSNSLNGIKDFLS